jgi:ABC-2 type transport system permease protein
MITGYLGSFLMAGAFLAISSFSSALTRSPVISFITSVFICMTLTLIGLGQVTNIFVDMVPKVIIDTAYASSILMHFSSLQRGIIDTQDIVYFTSIICGGLFFTGVVLKNHRAG